LVVGALNVALLAPVGIQLVHLLTSDLIWIMLVLLTVSALARSPRSVPIGNLSQQSLEP
jgi:cytochrome c oxidase assembly protein subunit 15